MNAADTDLFEEPFVPGGKRGGKRPGAGGKKGVPRSETADTYTVYAKARAEKETALARREELKFELESGSVVSRDDVRRATATAYSVITQTLRAIPDNIERRLGLAPEVIEEISRQIDDAMEVLSEDLAKMCEMGMRH